MVMWKVTYSCEIDFQDAAKTSSLVHFAQSCKNFAWSCKNFARSCKNFVGSCEINTHLIHFHAVFFNHLYLPCLALICIYFKFWIFDFSSFETIYSMPKNHLGKYSKYHLKVIVYVAARIWVPIGMYELQAISFNLLSRVFLLSNSFHNLHFFLSCYELLHFYLSKFSLCFTLWS